MKLISDRFIHFDHIIWQVAADCPCKCKNCYLQKLDWDEFVTDETLHSVSSELIYLLNTGQIKCNQFTISLDDSGNWRHLVKRVAKVLAWLLEPPHITLSAHTYRHILEYYSSTLPYAKSIAISEIDSTLYTRGGSCKSVILNHRASIGPSPFVGPVGKIHVILDKPALGDLPEPSSIDQYRDKLARLHQRPGPPVLRDRCEVTVLAEDKFPTHSCHAGISLAHIWPDGSVTGCPYDVYCRYGASALEIPTLLERFKHIEKIESPYEICKLRHK
jgi:hypothetical protein